MARKNIGDDFYQKGINSILNKYKDGFRQIALEGFEAVSVQNGNYKYHSIYQNTSINRIYDLLIAAARNEFEAEYGIRGGLRLPKEGVRPPNENELFNEIERGFEQYLNSLEKTTGKLSTTSFEKANFQGRTVEEIEYDVINILLSKECQGKARSNAIAWLRENQSFKMILGLLSKGSKQEFLAPNLGNLFEAIAASEIMLNINQVENNLIKKLTQTGAQKTAPKYTKKTGEQVSLKPVTGTRDAFIEIQTKKGTKGFGLTMKLAKDPLQIKYKSSVSEEGAPFVNIARWSNVLKTYTFWLNRSRATEKDDVKAYLAATLASLAVGGYGSERSLVGLLSAGQGPTLRSLDNILLDFKTGNRLTMDSLKMNKMEDYNINKVVAAAQLKPEIDRYNKYKEYRDVNLSFNLNTYVRK